VKPGSNLVLSYGPCQFPTLGLIVQRAWFVILSDNNRVEFCALGTLKHIFQRHFGPFMFDMRMQQKDRAVNFNGRGEGSLTNS